MTTTTSTTNTTASSASVIGTATQQLLTSLDAGSGVDTSSLVSSLVQAQFAQKTAQLTAKSDTLSAQISSVSSVRSAVTGFASALQQLVKGGTLSTQPNSSNTSVLTATALSGAKLNNLSSSIQVNQLAAAQGARTTAAVADRTAVIGSGTFTLTLGQATYATDAQTGTTSMTGFTAGSGTPVTIDLTDASLDGIAQAINAAKAGVTASVVTDADGSAYLSLKGATGAVQAFTLDATSDPQGVLGQFAVGVGKAGTTFTSQAQNAKLTVDGIAVERAGNSIDDLVAGVKLNLAATSTTPVSLTSTAPTAALSQAVSDVVDTYNQVYAVLKAQTDPITGNLRADPGMQALMRQMKTLTSQIMLPNAATGTPTTLGEIGIATTRDGTLQVNASTLTNALKSWPDSVETMFAIDPNDSTKGVVGKLNALASITTDKLYGLAASETRYTRAQADIGEQQDKVSDQSDQMKTRLTQQFASMNAKVAAYKSTQTFLKNQIDAWNNSNK